MPSESEVHTWRCKGCERLKGSANRWWAIKIGPARERGHERILTLRPFEEPLFDDEIAICSKRCGIGLVSRFMDETEVSQ